MKIVWVLLAIGVALALQTTLGRFVGTRGVDLVLVAVVFVALTSGPATGLLAGTVAGLAQDTLSSGIVGVGGLAKTLVGFLAGVVGRQFIVAQPLTRFVVFFAATMLHAVVFLGLYAVLQSGAVPRAYGVLAAQAAMNAGVGVLLFQIVEALPSTIQRRRASRGVLSRRHFGS